MSDDWVDVSRDDLIKKNADLMAALSSGTATRDDKKTLEKTMEAIEERTAEKNALGSMTRDALMKKNAALMAKVTGGSATRADAERLNDTMSAIKAEDKERTTAKRESAVLDSKALVKRNEALMAALTSGTATRADKAKLEATMDAIEKRTAEKSALGTMTRDDLMKKNAALMAKVKGGTATGADAESLKDTMAAMEAEDKERTTAKRESAALDSDALIKRNAKLMAALSSGTATRADKTKLEATMAAIEKAKADAVAVRTSMSMAELVKKNEALMKMMKEGTATRAEMEKASRITDELTRRTATKSKIEAETETRELIKRNEELMKSMKEGTVTRAEREELEAVMKRKEELDRELKATTAFETAARLTKARAELRITERKTAVRDVMKLVKDSERTDLCFMVDATGSMASHIEGVKTQIVKIATDVQKTNPQLKLRVAITGYRDALEGDGGNSPFDFSDNLETFVSKVSSIEAKGGGDGCEDVESGFSDLLRFSWASPTRVLFWIADAPSHGTRYHGGGANDNHPDCGRGIPDKLKQMKAMNLDVVFCKINGTTDTMLSVMNRDVGCSGADYIKTVDLADRNKLTAHVTSTLRKSMHGTLTASRARTKLKSHARDGLGGIAESDAESDGPRAFSIVSTEPDWAGVPALSAALYMNKKVVDVGALKSHGKLESMLVSAKDAFTGLFSWGGGKAKSHASCQIKVASEPFATGNLRLARYGRILAGDAKDATLDYHPAAWKSCVFKDFKSKDPKSHELARYLEEMEVNSVASALAAEFNKQHHPPVDRQMQYVLSSVALVTTAKGQRSYFMEPYLEGAFTRFSYNTGFWEEGVLDSWLLRFALWTYAVTDGFLMVADLQGVRNGKGYLLTDPVILCTDLSRFGNTNLGAEMMERCKASAEKHLADLTGAADTAVTMGIPIS